MGLSLADANRIVGASIAAAEEMGVRLSVAVVDAGGQLVAFQRMEGAIAVSATAAPGKAVGSVFFGRDSRLIDAGSPVMQAILGSQGGRIIPAQGAVPIYRDGVLLVGAIGGSGGTAQQDEDCVRKGLEAL